MERKRWDRAFELILRFELNDLVEPALEAAYKPLARLGHLGTLSTFARTARSLFVSSSYPAIIDLVDAEVASRDGEYTLAIDLATRFRCGLPAEHILATRAQTIIGHCAFSQADLETAESAFGVAYETANDDQDEAEALYGWALASIQGEVGDPEPILQKLKLRRQLCFSTLFGTGRWKVARRRFGDGLANPLRLEESIHALSRP